MIVNDYIYSASFKLKNNGDYDNILGKHHTLNNADNNYNIGFANKNTFSFGSFVTSAFAIHQSKINNKIYAVGAESAPNDSQTVKALFCKFDANLHIDTIINHGDTNFNYLHNQIVDFDSNKLLIGSSFSAINSNPIIRRMGLVKCDTNGVVLWQDSFEGKFNKEWFINLAIDTHENIYMNGVYSRTPGYNDDVGVTLKKVSSNGKLLRNVYLPYRRNSQIGFLTKIGSAVPKFIVVYAFRNDTINWPNLGIWDQEASLSYTYLDNNLNVYKAVDKYDNVYKYLNGTALLKNGNILMFGWGSLDSVYNEDRYGWARVVDTNANTIWDRNYAIRDSTYHVIYDAKEDENGNIYFGGFVSPKNHSPQVGFILKVDSNGCLDPAFCFPMGIKEISKIPDGAMQLYPNPACNSITLQLADAFYTGGNAIIYSADGKLVQRLSKVSTHQNIDISSYAPGNYYLQYSVGEWRGGVQFMVRK